MKSVAQIKIGDKSLFVRFDRVGRKSRFNQILDLWHRNFPQAEWNEQYKSWELSQANFIDVKLFCEKMFGLVEVDSLIFVPNQPRQMNLSL
jgi:hypothetical protein